LDGTTTAAAGPAADEYTPDAYTRTSDALPDTSGASDTVHASDATLEVGNTHSHTRTVNGALAQGPGTNGVADADNEPSGDGFDRDDDTVRDATGDADTAGDADTRGDCDDDVDAFADAPAAIVAPGDTLPMRDTLSDADAEAQPLADAQPETLASGTGETDGVEPSFLLADARCEPTME